MVMARTGMVVVLVPVEMRVLVARSDEVRVNMWTAVVAGGLPAAVRMTNRC
jgi:hypothetical protein